MADRDLVFGIFIEYMRIKDFNRIDRPREKLVKYGVERLSDKELLAIILNSGLKGKNVLQLADEANQLIKQNQIIDPRTFNKIPGLGLVKKCTLLACLEFGKRRYTHKKSALIMNPKEIFAEVKDIRSSKKEYFVAFFLDVRNQVIKREIISIGILNSSLVHPREVFEPAVRNIASQIIIVHNHPSGDIHPSDEDIIITKRLIKAGEILGIEILDHVIVTSDSYFSMKEKKYL